MRYYKQIEDGYLIAVGTGEGHEEIAQEEYEHILSVIGGCPDAEEGYGYKLRADLSWEKIEAQGIPAEEREISAGEFYRMIEEVL